MYNEANNTNILRSLVGVIGAAVLTVTVFYSAAGPDPRADVWMASATSVAAAPAGAVAA